MNIPKSEDFSGEKSTQFAAGKNDQETTSGNVEKDMNWKKAREVMAEQKKTIDRLSAKVASFEENPKRLARETLEKLLDCGDVKVRLESAKVLLELE